VHWLADVFNCRSKNLPAIAANIPVEPIEGLDQAHEK
jgi:hypothetical protein